MKHPNSLSSVSFDEPRFTFAEVAAATGADVNWLRTLLQRDKEGLIGAKQFGRLTFSLRDGIFVWLIWGFNAHLKLGPAAARELMEEFWKAFRQVLLESNGEDGDPLNLGKIPLNFGNIHIAFREDGAPVSWIDLNDGVAITYPDISSDDQVKIAVQYRSQPHICFSFAWVAQGVSRLISIKAADEIEP